MFVPTTLTSPETGAQRPRSRAPHCVTAAVAAAMIAAGIAIAIGDAPGASRSPSSNARSTERAAPSYPHEVWRYSDPRRRNGAGHAPIP